MGLRADNLKVHAMVAAWTWAPTREEGHGERHPHPRIVLTRHHVNITMCRAKANGNYINSMLALQEALDNGYDEALLLDTQGFVMEGSARTSSSCVMGAHTPDLTSALDGITRRTIIQLAEEADMKVVENASPATKSISPTKPSSPVRRRK